MKKDIQRAFIRILHKKQFSLAGVVGFLVTYTIGIMLSSGGFFNPSEPVTRYTVSQSFARESGFFYDEMKYLNGTEELERGLKKFYQETGVLPYVYFTNEVYGDYLPPVYMMLQFADDTYGKLFSDQRHFLLIAHKSVGEWSFSYWAGEQTRSIITGEMVDNLTERIVANYYSGEMNAGASFGEAFEYTLTKSPEEVALDEALIGCTLAVLVGGSLCVLIGRFLFDKKKSIKEDINDGNTR